MDKTIFINPKGIIEIIMPAKIEVVDAVRIGQRAITLATRLIDEGKPVNILINSTNVKEWGHNIHPMAVSVFGDLHYHKLATFGASPELIKRQKLVAAQLKDPAKTHIFSTKEEAEKWLLEK